MTASRSGLASRVSETPFSLYVLRRKRVAVEITPLIVLSAGTGTLPGWAAQQNDLATLSTASVHRRIPGATHASLIEDRVDAAQSSRAIRDVVKAARSAGINRDIEPA